MKNLPILPGLEDIQEASFVLAADELKDQMEDRGLQDVSIVHNANTGNYTITAHRANGQFASKDEIKSVLKEATAEIFSNSAPPQSTAIETERDVLDGTFKALNDNSGTDAPKADAPDNESKFTGYSVSGDDIPTLSGGPVAGFVDALRATPGTPEENSKFWQENPYGSAFPEDYTEDEELEAEAEAETNELPGADAELEDNGFDIAAAMQAANEDIDAEKKAKEEQRLQDVAAQDKAEQKKVVEDDIEAEDIKQEQDVKENAYDASLYPPEVNHLVTMIAGMGGQSPELVRDALGLDNGFVDKIAEKTTSDMFGPKQVIGKSIEFKEGSNVANIKYDDGSKLSIAPIIDLKTGEPKISVGFTKVKGEFTQEMANDVVNTFAALGKTEITLKGTRAQKQKMWMAAQLKQPPISVNEKSFKPKRKDIEALQKYIAQQNEVTVDEPIVGAEADPQIEINPSFKMIAMSLAGIYNFAAESGDEEMQAKAAEIITEITTEDGAGINPDVTDEQLKSVVEALAAEDGSTIHQTLDAALETLKGDTPSAPAQDAQMDDAPASNDAEQDDPATQADVNDAPEAPEDGGEPKKSSIIGAAMRKARSLFSARTAAEKVVNSTTSEKDTTSDERAKLVSEIEDAVEKMATKYETDRVENNEGLEETGTKLKEWTAISDLAQTDGLANLDGAALKELAQSLKDSDPDKAFKVITDANRPDEAQRPTPEAIPETTFADTRKDTPSQTTKSRPGM